MQKRSFIVANVLLSVVLLCGCNSQGITIDGYTHNSILTSGDSVPLGAQIILVCRVVGLPYGTPLSYTWTCPDGPCEVEGYYGRKVYNEHILAVNTTSTSDGGTYTCQVTATGGQEVAMSFTISVTGGSVVHSYGRLIPDEFPITDLQQISGPDGIGRITCTVSSGTASFHNIDRQLETRNGSTATLVVNPSNASSFQNRKLYCTNDNFYLFISSANPLTVPSLEVDSVTASEVRYKVRRLRNDAITNAVITGYEVTRFGVPMIGQYVNTGRGRKVAISPAVPGAQYRITAWALGDGRRSTTPAVVDATTGEARSSTPRMLSVSRILEAEVELNWLPPAEPNGEVHYVIYYTPENDTEQSIDIGSNLTHYNLTGLERNGVFTNIAVEAVNSAGTSERTAAVLIERAGKATPSSCPLITAPFSNPLILVVVSLVVVILLIIICVALLVLALAATATKLRRVSQHNKTYTDTRRKSYSLEECDKEDSYTTSVHSTAQHNRGEEEMVYAEVCIGQTPVLKLPSPMEGYRNLEPSTMNMNEYHTLMQDRASDKGINA